MNYNKELNVNTDYDVIVIGGGPSGCAAAISSARNNSKTLLIEQTSILGGMGTQGLIPAWCPFSDKKQPISRGIAMEVFDLAKSGMKHINKARLDWVEIDSELLKISYDKLVEESGCEVLFNTFLCDCVAEGKDVDYIVVSNKQGLTAYKAKVYIDCTGDADLVFYANGKFDIGEDNTTNNLQPATLCFQLANVNVAEYRKVPLMHGRNENSFFHEVVRKDQFKNIIDAHVCDYVIGEDVVGFNAGHIFNVDPTNPQSVSKAMLLGRKIAQEFRDCLALYQPKAFGNSFLVQTAPVLGQRESRRVKTLYELTVDDYADRRTFEDEIGRNCYFIDVHGNADAANPTGKIAEYNAGESYGIPYRTLLPKDFDNLLIAGKTIGCERMVQGSIRVMPACLVTGQAAGSAASLAVTNNVKVKDLDINVLQDHLEKNDVYLKKLEG